MVLWSKITSLSDGAPSKVCTSVCICAYVCVRECTVLRHFCSSTNPQVLVQEAGPSAIFWDCPHVRLPPTRKRKLEPFHPVIAPPPKHMRERAQRTQTLILKPCLQQQQIPFMSNVNDQKRINNGGMLNTSFAAHTQFACAPKRSA